MNAERIQAIKESFLQYAEQKAPLYKSAYALGITIGLLTDEQWEYISTHFQAE